MIDILADYSPEQLGSFWRAFIEHKADFIKLDGWSPEWAKKDAAMLQEKGHVKVEVCGDAQYTLLKLRPTPKFKRALKALGKDPSK